MEKSRPEGGMATGLSAAVIERIQDFALLEKEWDELYRNAHGSTPFQSWAWMYSWWETYGAGYELRIVTLRDSEGLLVGLLPLMLERRRGLGVLLFIGTRRNDYQDILAREGWQQRISDAARQGLIQIGGWHVADLHQLRPGSVGWSVLRAWRGPRAWICHEGSPLVAAKPWDELVATLSKNQRSTVRRTLRRAAADGVRAERVRPEDAELAARRLVALHRELWQGKNMTPEHSTARWASFIESAARRMTSRGLGEMSEFRRSGEVVISLFWLIGPDFVGFYHSGVSRWVLERYQWNALLVQAGTAIARARGAAYLDLLRGEQDYKLQWASKVIPSRRLILGRNLLAWSAYAGFHVLRARLETFIFSPGCPTWVRDVARGLKRILR